MKKIMILGASILQLPAILKAKKMGLEVIAVDMDKDAIGFKYADICLEISTIDIPRVLEAAKHYNIDGIMTLASDMPMRTVARVCTELNLPGINEETAVRATNKATMRECLYRFNVPIPQFYRVKDMDKYLEAVSKIEGKKIIKPADNSGSRGVYLLCDDSDSESKRYAFEYSKQYSRNGEIVVEEYMEGPEVSVEALSIDGSVHVIAITDKMTTGAPNFVEMGHSQPSRLSEKIKKDIENVAIKAIKSIGIKNGPSHTEIIVTKSGAKIVEIGARLGGDNITTHLVPLSTGVDLVKSCIQIALGYAPDLNNREEKASAIRYLEIENGRISEIFGMEEAQNIKGIKQVSILKNVGEYVNKITSSSDRVGFVISQAENVDLAIEICNRSKSLIGFRMER